jgi:hypothetical protein
VIPTTLIQPADRNKSFPASEIKGLFDSPSPSATPPPPENPQPNDDTPATLGRGAMLRIAAVCIIGLGVSAVVAWNTFGPSEKPGPVQSPPQVAAETGQQNPAPWDDGIAPEDPATWTADAPPSGSPLAEEARVEFLRVDAVTTHLPPRFLGHDTERLYLTLRDHKDAILAKDPFETTAAHESRVAQAWSQFSIGEWSIGDPLVLQIASGSQIVGGIEYDADNGYFDIKD